MRRTMALSAVLVWLAGCGGGEPEAKTQNVDGAGVRRLVVTNEGGGLKLETAAGGGIRIRGAIKNSALRESVLRVKGDGGTLELSVPPGLDLVANQKGGDITIVGRWGTLELNATGNVSVEADALAGGRIETSAGAIRCRSGSRPTGSLRCKSISGDVYVGVPETYRGVVQLASEAGEIDVEAHPRLRMRRDATMRSIVGFAGAGFTAEEHADLPVDKRPGVWATSGRGKVTFRLEAKRS